MKMTEAERQTTLEKLSKLMQLAARGSTEGEKNAALKQARNIMEKHNIQEYEFSMEENGVGYEVDADVTLHERAGTAENQDVLLAQAVGDLCDVRIYIKTYYGLNKHHNLSRIQSIQMFGSKMDVQIATRLFNELFITMRAMVKMRCGKYNRHYMDGFAAAIYNRVQESKKQHQLSQKGTEIVVYKSSALDEYAASLDLQEGECQRRKTEDPAALQMGYSDGQRADLSTGGKLD